MQYYTQPVELTTIIFNVSQFAYVNWKEMNLQSQRHGMEEDENWEITIHCPSM